MGKRVSDSHFSILTACIPKKLSLTIFLIRYTVEAV
jgi:hypothetical protein